MKHYSVVFTLFSAVAIAGHASPGLANQVTYNDSGNFFSSGAGSATLLGQFTGEEGQGDEAESAESAEGGGNADNRQRAVRPNPRGNPVGTPGGTGVSPISGVLNALEVSNSACNAVPDEYVIDCMINYLREALAATPGDEVYAGMRQTLEDTIAKLEALVRENRDQSKPAIRVRTRSAGVTKSSQPLRAIKTESVPQAKAAATAILAEAETKLLRSSEAQSGARLQYARVAQAIGSNKVLLRS